VRRLWIAIGAMTLTACGSTPAPPAPPVVDPGASQTITGTERIGWEQQARDAVELATIRYAIYVDGTRTEIEGASCTAIAGSASFSCTGRLPALTAGAHALQIASFVNDGGVLESAKSAALRVTVVPATAPAPAAAPFTATAFVTKDGVRMRAEPLVDGVVAPTDLAFAPNGRLFVAEHAGTVRVIRDGRLRQEPAIALADMFGRDVRLLALAFDPQFERTRSVFVIVSAPTRSGEPAFSLARLREVSDTLGDAVVLLDGIRASSRPSAALRFGPDGKLYAAFDDGGDARRRGDAASLNAKLLRLEPDGTTPHDQAGSTPVYAEGAGSPAGLAWDRSASALWIADRVDAGSSQLRAIVPQPGAPATEQRGMARGAYALPTATPPSALAFYRGDLFPAFKDSLLVASEDGRHLLRVRFDGARTMRPIATERLLQDIAGGLRAVAVGPDGAIYFGTSRTIGRIVAADER
jgi:quinoprotein glucose dehydrogenase